MRVTVKLAPQVFIRVLLAPQVVLEFLINFRNSSVDLVKKNEILKNEVLTSRGTSLIKIERFNSSSTCTRNSSRVPDRF